MTIYTRELLDTMRQVGDPETDDIIAELAANHQIEEVNRILEHLIRNQQLVPTELPDNIENWLRQTGRLPDDVDFDRLDRAATFFLEHGALITLLLSTAALVTCYAGVKGSKVLTFSYRMGQNPYHRIAETGQFVLYVMAKDGFRPEGSAVRTAQKVRLLHTAVRHLILQSGKWDLAALDIPICQEDLLGTLMIFSYGVIHGLRELGTAVSDQEAEDYLYAWRLVGKIMGIRPEIIPQDMAAAQEAAEIIAERQMGPSPDGVYLTQSLLEMHYGLIPGTKFDGVVAALIRQLTGDKIADWMQVPQSRWQTAVKHINKMGKTFDFFDDVFGSMEDMLDRLAVSLLMRNTINVSNYERVSFHLPTELKGRLLEKGNLSAEEIEVLKQE